MGIKIYINPPKNVYDERNINVIKRKLQVLLLNCSPHSVDEFFHNVVRRNII